MSTNIIGASLNKPHTSGTVLQRCVCMSVCSHILSDCESDKAIKHKAFKQEAIGLQFSFMIEVLPLKMTCKSVHFVGTSEKILNECI